VKKKFEQITHTALLTKTKENRNVQNVFFYISS